MSVSLHELLQPQVILDVVSRVRARQGRLGRWIGFQPNRYDPSVPTLAGANTVRGNTRYATFRLFDYSRVVAKFRAPDTGPATVAANPTGDVRISCARMHEKIPLSYEELGNLSPIVGPNAVIDPGGQDYITRQTRFIGQQFNSAIEMLTTGMFQDNLWFQQQGDNWIAAIGNPGGVSFQVNFGIPSGNKNQLNMLGTGNLITISWDNVGAPIFKMLSAIKAAYAQLSGYPLMHIWINSLMWYNIITNTEIRNLAGSANQPMASYTEMPEKDMSGMPTEGYEAMLRCDGTVRFHITDEVVVTGNTDTDPSYGTAPAAATFTKVVPDKFAFFLPEPSGDWTKMYHGAEYVVENPGMPGALRSGYYFWREYVTQPSKVDLIGLLNCIPLLYIPKVVAPGQVVFP
jgi:hypothetical protein